MKRSITYVQLPEGEWKASGEGNVTHVLLHLGDLMAHFKLREAADLVGCKFATLANINRPYGVKWRNRFISNRSGSRGQSRKNDKIHQAYNNHWQKISIALVFQLGKQNKQAPLFLAFKQMKVNQDEGLMFIRTQDGRKPKKLRVRLERSAFAPWSTISVPTVNLTSPTKKQKTIQYEQEEQKASVLSPPGASSDTEDECERDSPHPFDNTDKVKLPSEETGGSNMTSSFFPPPSTFVEPEWTSFRSIPTKPLSDAHSPVNETPTCSFADYSTSAAGDDLLLPNQTPATRENIFSGEMEQDFSVFGDTDVHQGWIAHPPQFYHPISTPCDQTPFDLLDSLHEEQTTNPLWFDF